MEHLTVLRLVGERDVVQMDSHTAEGSLLLRPLEFRGIQDGGDLPHIGAHHRQFIHKGHGGNQRPCETQGQHYNSEEGGGGQAATGPQQQSHRQYRQQHRGDHRLHDGHELLVLRHPVHIVLGVLRHRVGISLVGTGGLAEGLHHLDAAHILHNRVGHTAAHLHRPLPAGAVGLGALHGHQDTHHRGHQGCQPHPPIQHEDVDRDGQGNQQVGGHLRQQVGQGGLHALHPVHDGGLVLAGRGIQNRAHGHPAQLRQQRPADPPQGMIGRGVGQRRGPSGEQGFPQIPHQRARV